MPFPDLLTTTLFPLLSSLLPDFIVSFTFFAAVIYAVLGRRFGHQRPAVAIAAALGFALSVGLVWWEYQHDWSMRDLGPLAIGFLMIMLGMVLFQAIRQVGGSWSGAGLALGASVIVGWLLGLDWSVDARALQTGVTVALVVGVLAFLLHRHGVSWQLPKARIADVRHDRRDLYQDEAVSDRMAGRFRRLRREVPVAARRPQNAQDIARQIRRMLPAEGWLTQRLAELRKRAHYARKGHVARIEEVQHVVGKLPLEARKRASEQLVASYMELQLDRRLERLDKAAAEIEKRIRGLTQEAEQAAGRYEFRRLYDVLKRAEKLQQHKSRIFERIENTEKKLMALARQAASNAGGVSDA